MYPNERGNLRQVSMINLEFTYKRLCLLQGNRNLGQTNLLLTHLYVNSKESKLRYTREPVTWRTGESESGQEDRKSEGAAPGRDVVRSA